MTAGTPDGNAAGTSGGSRDDSRIGGQFAAIAWLRWRLFQNGMRTTRGRLEVVFRIFMALGFLAKGQTNFVKMLWKFSSVYNATRQMADHQREVRYPIRLPETAPPKKVDQTLLYIHQPETAHASHGV